MRLTYLTLVVLVLLARGLALGMERPVQPLVVSEGFSFQNTANVLQFYEDRQGTATFATISTRDFHHDPQHKLNWGIASHPVWLKFLVEDRRTLPEPLILVFDYPLLDEVDYQVCTSDYEGLKSCGGDSLVIQAGRLRPERRMEQVAPRDEIRLWTAGSGPVRTYAIWVKVRQSAGSMQVSSTLYTQSEYLRFQRQEILGTGLYLGGLFILIVYNCFVCVSLRSWKYFYYVFYMSVYTAYQYFVSGYGYAMIGDILGPSWGGKIIPVGVLLFGNSALIFAVSFLAIKRIAPRFFWVCMAFSAVLLAVVLMSPWLPSQTLYRITVGYLGPLWIVIEISCGVLALRSREYRRSAILYLISWSAFVLGSFLLNLRALGILPMNFFTLYGQQIGSWLEGVLMSFAMADVINQLRRRTDEQATNLAEANEQLRKADQQLRHELKTRNHLVSSLSHRTNNPLNYIALHSQVIHQGLDAHRQILMALLADEEGEADDEKRKIRAQFAEQLDALQDGLKQIGIGLSYSSRSIADIRQISGVDGFTLENIHLPDLIEELRQRCAAASGTCLMQLQFLAKDDKKLSLQGNKVFLSLLLEMIFTRCFHTVEKREIYLRLYKIDEEYTELRISESNTQFELALGSDDMEHIRYLLDSHSIWLSFPAEDTFSLRFAKHHDAVEEAA